MKMLLSENLAAAATLLQVDFCTVHAVCQVESRGKAFFCHGKPTLLFEGHVFWKELQKRGIDPKPHQANFPHLVYPQWTRKFYAQTQAKEQIRWEQAKKIHLEAALCAASYGLFQIMGFNYALCGFSSITEFMQAHTSTAAAHLSAFICFVYNSGLHKPLQKQQWATFAKRYNGAGYKANKYDEKLLAAYEACRQRKVHMPS